uniref:Secreted protein n=1 Tax=Echinococcus granulosus TaxID=6210 RepID=A0A068WQ84_ECHGR|nr:hypothetical protein EgrG_001137100 [Echinococcus granulosus]
MTKLLLPALMLLCVVYLSQGRVNADPESKSMAIIPARVVVSVSLIADVEAMEIASNTRGTASASVVNLHKRRSINSPHPKHFSTNGSFLLLPIKKPGINKIFPSF